MEAGGCTYQRWKYRMGGRGGDKVSQRFKRKLEREGQGMGLVTTEGNFMFLKH